MTERTQTDELSIYNQVQKIIRDLLEFDKDSRARVYRTVGAFFGFDDAHPPTTSGSGVTTSSRRSPRDPHFSTPEAPSLKDFLFQKAPNTDVERVACLAYYLAHHRDSPRFGTIDISKLNTEAAQVKFSNPSAAISNAIRAGLLTTAAKGERQLTAHGERYVEALPDHASAKQIISRRRPRRARKKSAGNGTGNAGASNGGN